MKRKHFIKDLYNPKKILDNFIQLEFESFSCFVNVLKAGLYTTLEHQEIIIPVKKNEVDLMKKLLTESYLYDKTNVILSFEWEDFVEFTTQMDENVVKKSFAILINEPQKNLDEINDLNKHFSTWSVDNPIWTKIKVDYENFRTKFNDAVTIYNKQRIRFLKFQFDYASFDKMTLKEIRELEWRMKQFNQWYSASRNKKYDVGEIVVNRTYPKTLFISNEWKLYVNKTAFEENVLLFDLSEHLEDNGETIDFYDLSLLRSYMDLQKDYINPKVKDHKFVDFYQNKKILGEYVELPHIAKFISEVFCNV